MGGQGRGGVGLCWEPWSLGWTLVYVGLLACVTLGMVWD